MHINFPDYFKDLKDPRVPGLIACPLDELLLTTLCAVLSGHEDWSDISTYGREKLDFLRRFLPYASGAPGKDVYRNVFSLIEFESFSACFGRWVASVCARVEGVAAIDGKTLRGSRNAKNGKKAVHMVSAFAHAQGITLAQEAVSEKSNEITAIPRLLDGLVLEGTIVTIDATGTQKKIAEKIIERKADYVLSVKDSQPSLAEAVERFFRIREKDRWRSYSHRFCEDVDAGHGRIETRRLWVSDDVKFLNPVNEWPGARSVAKIESRRLVAGEETVEIRHFISSLSADAIKIAEAVRAHWSVENRLHWVLDVQLGDDLCRMRVKNLPKNFHLLKQIAVNVLRQNPLKTSLKAKRTKAALNESFLTELLRQYNPKKIEKLKI